MEGMNHLMQKELNIQNVADDIRAVLSHNPNLVKKIGIFGSLARGDFNEDSDIDLLAWYDAPSVFSMDRITQYCELCAKIEEVLTGIYKRSVEIADIQDEALSNIFDPNVKNEVFWLWIQTGETELFCRRFVKTKKYYLIQWKSYAFLRPPIWRLNNILIKRFRDTASHNYGQISDEMAFACITHCTEKQFILKVSELITELQNNQEQTEVTQ